MAADSMADPETSGKKGGLLTMMPFSISPKVCSSPWLIYSPKGIISVPTQAWDSPPSSSVLGAMSSCYGTFLSKLVLVITAFLEWNEHWLSGAYLEPTLDSNRVLFAEWLPQESTLGRTLLWSLRALPWVSEGCCTTLSECHRILGISIKSNCRHIGCAHAGPKMTKDEKYLII